MKLMIADEPSMVRDGIKYLLKLDKQIEVIAEASNKEECLKLLYSKKPDLLILDLTMQHEEGFEILRELNEDKRCDSKILILTYQDELKYVAKAVEIGIDGYILKSSGFEELKKAISEIWNGKKYMQPELMELINFQKKNIENDIDKLNRLTKRELDVLKNLSVGMYNKEIALKLNISERTVKNHVSNIFKKVGVTDRTQAAVFAIRSHLININD